LPGTSRCWRISGFAWDAVKAVVAVTGAAVPAEDDDAVDAEVTVRRFSSVNDAEPISKNVMPNDR